MKGASRLIDDLPFRGRIYPACLEASAAFASVSIAPRLRSSAPVASNSAVSRARARMRRYVVGNDLGHHLTLTTGQPRDLKELKAAFDLLIDRYRRRNGRTPFLLVPELGSGRAHLHLVTGSGLAAACRNEWPLGLVHLQLVDCVDARRSIATYLTKELEGPLLPSRYYIARGFSPQGIPTNGRSRSEFVQRAEQAFGRPAEVESGSPAHIYLQWSEAAA